MNGIATQFKKGNKAATKNKGKLKKKTAIKRKILEWAEAGELVEKNILEFLNSPNKKERMFATKNFAEFIKPKKREQSGNISGTIVFQINKNLIEEAKEVKQIDSKNNE